MKVTRFDDNGHYICTMECLEESLQWENPDRIYFGEPNHATQYHDLATGEPVDMPPKPAPYFTFDFVTKEWVDLRTPEVRAAAYRFARAKDYPAVGDQLDAIWKFIETGATPEELLERIRAVKATHPKPADVDSQD